MFGSLIQIITAFILVVLLFAIGFFIYNMEMVNSFREARKIKKDITIIKGIKDMKESASYNTLVKNDPNFRDISPSINQASGAEFTYNFWLYKDNSVFPEPEALSSEIQHTDAGLKPDDFVLFVHGDRKTYDYPNVCGVPKNDIKIKCPLVKLERGGDILTVEFNTVASPDVVKEQARNVCREYSTDWMFMNAHKIAIRGLRNPDRNKKWMMVTIIIQDTTPTDPLPIRNKIRCRIYINGTLELDRYVDSGLGLYSGQSLLRRNNAFFHVAPQISITPFNDDVPGGTPTGPRASTTTTKTLSTSDSLLIADLKYHNYALDAETVRNMFKQGFTRELSVKVEQNVVVNAVLKADTQIPSGKKDFSTL